MDEAEIRAQEMHNQHMREHAELVRLRADKAALLAMLQKIADAYTANDVAHYLATTAIKQVTG